MQSRDPNAPAPDPDDHKPWFAVVSFTNPHDIATYPAVIAQALPADPDAAPPPAGLPTPPIQSIFGPLTVPPQEQLSMLPTAGTMRVPLNPLGFPQACASATPTQNETLTDKPSCQHDYAYKVGLALSAKTGFNIVSGQDSDNIQAAVALALRSSIPFQLAKDPAQACLDFIQFYGYLHSVMDVQIDRVLQALEESGQAANTIVVFLSDHGELAAAHGMMMEKWHCAYQEALHVPVVVKFPQAEAGEPQGGGRQIDALTSHADILPTILGLAGVTARERASIAQRLAAHRPVPPLVGVDLAPLLRGETHVVTEPDGRPREGVLFITDDEITAPLPPSRVPDAFEQRSLKEFAVYCATVDAVREGTLGKGPVPDLASGAVRQPNHVRCVRTRDYKLARYFDPAHTVPQQWEMYALAHDPNETTTLVRIHGTPPTARDQLPHWTDSRTVQLAADRLAILLAELEQRCL